jgi:hypothetical protein
MWCVSVSFLPLQLETHYDLSISDLCIRHKKVFAHEHTLYPPNILPLHLPSMLSQQRSSNKSAAAGNGKDKIEGGTHPLCEFCRECFVSDDELCKHMHEKVSSPPKNLLCH